MSDNSKEQNNFLLETFFGTDDPEEAKKLHEENRNKIMEFFARRDDPNYELSYETMVQNGIVISNMNPVWIKKARV